MNRKFVVVSRMDGKDQVAIDHIVSEIKKPDKGSAFDRKTRLIRWLPGTWLIFLLKILRYDGVLLYVDGRILSHAFYQKHGNAWYIFAMKTHKDFRRRGLAKDVLRQVVINAYAKNLRGIRLGISGGGEAIECLRKDIVGGGLDLPFSCKNDSGPGAFAFIREANPEPTPERRTVS